MKNINKKKYNLFVLPLIICFVQFCFIFVAIINSGYFFEKNVLITSSFVFLIWLFLYLFHENKNKEGFCINTFTVLRIVLGLFLGFWFVKTCWFCGYLNLEPIKNLIDGKAHIDTLYHSTIAESFITNGYASINFNEPTHLKYHTLSHFILSLISRIIRIPCLITYNYLFPIIFVPIYVCLVQKTIFTIKKQYNYEREFLKIELIFLTLFFIGFFPKEFLYKTGLFLTASYGSESCLLSLIIIMLGYNLFVRFENKTIYQINIAFLVVIPVTIILSSLSKISTGTIFTFYICYYLLRDGPTKRNNWLLIFLYSFIFIFIYKISSDAASHDMVSIQLFHFMKNWGSKNYYLMHYFILLLPALILCLLKVRDINVFKNYIKDKDNIVPETLLLGSIISFLPGIFMTIGGGSAFYFCIPAFICSVIFLFGTNCINILFNNISCRFKILILVIILCSVFYPTCNFIQPKDIIHKTIAASNEKQLSLMGKGKIQKIKQCFEKSEYCNNEIYNTLLEIKNITRGKEKEYCIFVSDDCSFYNIYPYCNNYLPYGSKPYFAITSFLGLPIINAISEDNGTIIRGDNKPIGTCGVNEYYGLSTVKKRIFIPSEKDMKNIANEMGKLYIIVLEKDSFDIVKVK